MKKIFFIVILIYIAFLIVSMIQGFLPSLQDFDFQEFKEYRKLFDFGLTLWAFGLLAMFSFEKLK